MKKTFLITYAGNNGTAIDVQSAVNSFEAVVLHRRYFGGRVAYIEIRQIGA